MGGGGQRERRETREKDNYLNAQFRRRVCFSVQYSSFSFIIL